MTPDYPGVQTERLELVPATVALLEADLESHAKLASVLNAQVPESWPPGEYDAPAMRYFRDRLTEDPDAAPWYGWYVLSRPTSQRPRTLIGAGGFFGPPGADGIIEIGYSVARDFKRRGYATEFVRALVDHAFATGQVRRIVARTTAENPGSIRVLERAGFQFAGAGQEPGSVQYKRDSPARGA